MICVIVCLAGLHTVRAQPTLGLKAGLNVSDIVMTNYVNPDVESDLGIKTGLHAGVFFLGQMQDRLGLGVELLYSNKGVKANRSIHLHYITLPVMGQYSLGQNIHAEFGPELAYMVAATSGHGSAIGSYNNKLDLALNAGLRFDLSRWMLHVRYSAGLFSVRDPVPAIGASGPEKVKYQNRVLQFSIGRRLFDLEGGDD